jgi:hypothetical protein
VPSSGRAPDWTVGTRIPDLAGVDQYGVVRKLRDRNGRWRVLDVCAWWCAPCWDVAESHKEFSDYVNASGIAFEIVTVVTENSSEAVSTQRDAERWAERHHLDDDIVMHCDGNEGSPLRQIVAGLAAANGSATGGYPTYAILDPSGTICHYQVGADLNRLQAELARVTGTPLDRHWSGSGRPVGRGGTQPALPAIITATRSNGEPISERLPGSTLVDLQLGLAYLGRFDGDSGFDLDRPITLTFPLIELPGVEYAYRFSATPEVALGFIASPEDPNIPIYAGTATLAADATGAVQLACLPFRPSVPADADEHQWQYLVLDVQVEPVTTLRAVELLAADVATEASLSAGARNGIGAALGTVETNLIRRDFEAALRHAEKVQERLQRTSNRVLHFHVASLIGHLANVVGRPPA